MAVEGLSRSLEYTPTWIVAVVCSIIVLMSIIAERGLHRLGKCLRRRDQEALFEALQKLKEELMLLGFISLLLTVSQTTISKMCIPTHLASYMLPCKLPEHRVPSSEHPPPPTRRHLLAEDIGGQHCARKGMVQLMSLEGLHQLHIFVFVLAVVHVIFCATTMVLAGAKIREWKRWEESIRSEGARGRAHHHHHQFFFERAITGRKRKLPVVRWMVSFFKQFYGSVTKSDYIALRSGFIREHCPAYPNFDFHKYMLRTLEYDFKRIVGISWYLWLFVVVFLLLNISGWHTYFWLSFLPLILLLLVGAHLEHVISRLARDAADRSSMENPPPVKPSDDHFWFNNPKIVIYLIHFILFQNSFEIAFFFWVWTTYGFKSCIMEKLSYIIVKLLIGVIVQVLCSYSTLPLYAIVTQMGSMFKPGIFNQFVQSLVDDWAGSSRERAMRRTTKPSKTDNQLNRLESQAPVNGYIHEQEAETTGVIALRLELPSPN